MGKKGGVDPKWRRRDLCRYAIALTDIHLATQTCDLMLADEPGYADPRYWAYHTAIVNAYARPFTENKPLGQLPGSVLRGLDNDQRALHRQILHDRKTASAHSDLSARPVQFVPRGARVAGETSGGGGFVIGKTAWGLGEWEAVKELTIVVGTEVQAEAFRLVELIYGDMYAPEPINISID